MMPGLNRSLAARAAASSSGRSSSEQRIRGRASSREMGAPGRNFASAEALSEVGRDGSGVMGVTATLTRMIQRRGVVMYAVAAERAGRERQFRFGGWKAGWIE